LEALEPRLVPSTDPFASPAFQQQLSTLMQTSDIPQASLAVSRGGSMYTYTVTNDTFYTSRGLPLPSPVAPDSLFRIGSISKSFTAVAAMTLVQQNLLNLSDSALVQLGYKIGDTISGHDPTNPINPVSATLPDRLFDISIADLLDMTSGLPLAVPVVSQTSVDAQKAGLNPPDEDQVLYTWGSYAALAFDGKPPYALPATSDQQIRYYWYELSTEINQGKVTLPTPGSVYEYSDTGYAILGNIVQRTAQEKLGLSYADYLQQYVLTPMGIAAPPPAGSPVTNPAMAAVGHTLASQAYPTEVAYNAYANEPPQPSIFPNVMAKVAPFYQTDSNGNPVTAAAPYGGDFYLESHFGNGGLVATPTALVQFFTNLGNAYTGAGTGPLTRQSVIRMVQEPPIGEDLKNGWFGLGWEVHTPGSPPVPNATVWVKNGALPGNSAMLHRNQDGTVWAIAFNSDVFRDPNTTIPPPVDTTLSQLFVGLMQHAIYGPATLTATAGTPQTAPLNTAFGTPLQVVVQDPFGDPVSGVSVTFTAPSGGPSGTFQASATVTTGSTGTATAPTFVANGVPGSYTVTATAGSLSAGFALANVPGSPVSPVPPIADLFGPHPKSNAFVAYVNGLYHAVLGRDADPVGMAGWFGLLIAGVSRAQVAEGVWTSAEHRGLQVDSYYQTFLHRAADPAGQAAWVAAFQAGADESQVVLGFLTSAEYFADNAGDTAFVASLYGNVLQRAPDAAGEQAALAFLAGGGSDATLARGFVLSPESFLRALAGYYGAYLQRPADAAGQAAWLNALEAGTADYGSVAISFLASDEFFSDAQAAVLSPL
jgi:CubicO group peptidase (beta-lactamase class C family)